MKQSTRFWVHSQIGGDDGFDAALNAASIWADHDGQSVETDEYHFVHTPYRECSPYMGERDCGFGGSGKCLVSGIEQYLRESIDESIPQADRTVALKMLIHLFADLFQPLHTGFAEDFGGNAISLLNTDTQGESLTLHGYWDRVFSNGSVQGLSRKAIQSRSTVNAGELADSLTRAGGVSAWLARVVSHNTASYTCGLAYKHAAGDWIESGDLLSGEYAINGEALAVEMLINAGYTLGRVLDRIAGIWAGRQITSGEKSIPTESNYDGVVTSNRYEILTVDEFDFDPELVEAESAQASADHMPEKFSKKKPPTLDFGLNLAEIGVRLVRGKHNLYITSHARAALFRGGAVPGNTFGIFRVEFVRNSRGNRIFDVFVDTKAFTHAVVMHPEFALFLIYRLRGRKYDGKTIMPTGKTAPII